MFDISVRNPIARSFTSYEIAIKTTDPAFTSKRSSVRRRYSEFCWLRKRLQFHHPTCALPELPPKQIFGTTDINFIIQRMKGLESWIIELTKEPMFISDTTVHLFLQTQLTCEEIEKYLKGEISEEYIQSFWKASSVTEDDKSSIINREKEQEVDHKDVAVSNTNGVDNALPLSGSSIEDLVFVSDYSSCINSGNSADSLKVTERTKSYSPLLEVDSEQNQSLRKYRFSEYSEKIIDVDRLKEEGDHTKTENLAINMCISSANKHNNDGDKCSTDDKKGSFDVIKNGRETDLDSAHLVTVVMDISSLVKVVMDISSLVVVMDIHISSLVKVVMDISSLVTVVMDISSLVTVVMDISSLVVVMDISSLVKVVMDISSLVTVVMDISSLVTVVMDISSLVKVVMDINSPVTVVMDISRRMAHR
ncbi:hypothetical protein CHS0354_024280 [Potamilus streckersoni]|uniref:PX domain-containing protein n=1 Tax=Potamilus streckersoni TaxID=2493646 RepID=A0AAE0VSD6_9BIVA|nr:hypothetical protein CHS0354_024280 [Potamilus streckersoni]